MLSFHPQRTGGVRKFLPKAKQFTVRVTRADIAADTGSRIDATCCPGANAIRRALGGRFGDIQCIVWNANVGGRHIPLPKRAASRIHCYTTTTGTLQPFSFRLTLPAGEYIIAP